MCSTATMDMLEQTAREFISQGRAFSGYELTIETRTREKIKLNHRDIKNDIHRIPVLVDEVDFGDYAKTLIPVDKANPNGPAFFVYHPKTYDISQYQPLHTPPGSPPAPVINVASKPVPALPAPASLTVVDSDVQDSGGQMSDGSFATDYQHRLLIPTRFLRDAGLTPGMTAYVIPDVNSQTLFISPQALASLMGVALTGKIVEKNGHVRVWQSLLLDAGLGANGGDKFVIENTTKDQTPVVQVKQFK